MDLCVENLVCLSDTPIFSDTKKDMFLDLWIVSSEINQIKADSVQTKAPRGPEINEGWAKKQKKGIVRPSADAY